MKQYKENEDGGLEIDGMSIPKDGGNRHYRKAMEEIEKGEAEILPYVAPVKTTEELRGEAYRAQGVTIEAMVIAMWERLIENRQEAVQKLQAKRNKIKAKYTGE